jgi:hypothetical protein
MAIHEAKSLSDTWTEPVQAPAVAFTDNVAGFIPVENVTDNVLPAIGVALFAGLVAVTVGGNAQVTVLSHAVPPLWLHVVPTGNGGFDGTPLVQISFVHWLGSTGRSALSLTVTVEPEPLHWFFLQSPAVCIATGVPAAVFETPHEPAEHVRVWHSVSVPAHCVATLHCTQNVAPSQ